MDKKNITLKKDRYKYAREFIDTYFGEQYAIPDKYDKIVRAAVDVSSLSTRLKRMVIKRFSGYSLREICWTEGVNSTNIDNTIQTINRSIEELIHTPLTYSILSHCIKNNISPDKIGEIEIVNKYDEYGYHKDLVRAFISTVTGEKLPIPKNFNKIMDAYYEMNSHRTPAAKKKIAMLNMWLKGKKCSEIGALYNMTTDNARRGINIAERHFPKVLKHALKYGSIFKVNKSEETLIFSDGNNDPWVFEPYHCNETSDTERRILMHTIKTISTNIANSIDFIRTTR